MYTGSYRSFEKECAFIYIFTVLVSSTTVFLQDMTPVWVIAICNFRLSSNGGQRLSKKLQDAVMFEASTRIHRVDGVKVTDLEYGNAGNVDSDMDEEFCNLQRYTIVQLPNVQNFPQVDDSESPSKKVKRDSWFYLLGHIHEHEDEVTIPFHDNVLKE